MQEIRLFLERVLVVIVVYRRALENSPTWNSLSVELTRLQSNMSIFVYDNSPGPQSIPLCDFIDGYYHHDSSNAGVSTAYNHGNQMAVQLKKEWLLLLDQDTQLTRGALVQYYEAFEANPSNILFAPILVDHSGILSPFRYRRGGGTRIGAMPETNMPIRKYRVINSGILVKCSAFNEVGGYEASLPLDFSDISFLEKLRAVTKNIIVVRTSCRHEFSGSSKMNMVESRDRFTAYVRGAYSFSKLAGNPFWLLIRTLGRASKLTVRYRSIAFLVIHYRTWYHR